MKQKLYFLFILTFCWNFTFAQQTIENFKECRISAGVGFAGGENNTKTVGKSTWVQLDYLFAKKLSVATEYQNLKYTNDGPNVLVRSTPNEEIIVNNSFAILFKYHLQKFGKFNAAIGSGWAYNIEASDYYTVRIDSNSYSTTKYVSYYDDYRIPVIAQIDYQITKTINVQARVRYNISNQHGNSYSAGLAIAVKL